MKEMDVSLTTDVVQIDSESCASVLYSPQMPKQPTPSSAYSPVSNFPSQTSVLTFYIQLAVSYFFPSLFLCPLFPAPLRHGSEAQVLISHLLLVYGYVGKEKHDITGETLSDKHLTSLPQMYPKTSIPSVCVCFFHSLSIRTRVTS